MNEPAKDGNPKRALTTTSFMRGMTAMADPILSDLLEYDLSSPSFLRWKIYRGRLAKAGSPAGTMHKSGYYRIHFLGRFEFAHRLIWNMHRGDIPDGMQIDHIDGNRTNNAIENLRLATHAENKRNERTRKDSKSGVKGLHWFAAQERWRGQVYVNGELHMKTSKDRYVVESWLKETRHLLHGEFARNK